MNKSYARLMSDIEKLQKKAADIQTNVIDRIRRDIAQHGLTVEQLFGGAPNKTTSRRVSTKSISKKVAKFADELGNTWSGMGKRPGWLKSALDAGKQIDDFLVTSANKAVASVSKAVSAKPAKKKTAAKKVTKPLVKTTSKAAPKPAAKKTAKSVATKATSGSKVNTPKKRSAKSGTAATKTAAANATLAT
ncbi:DNA-binding protein H-NS [Paucibacter oligotrophus]|uniref:DNA-binding protein H-NS n=1 Tax=Roseateles oligotrophus TaxID=1769250 RepID=A0A840L3V3_9BURK|nr:H-NS histone family protein [Roseateles oligotrophus]MBB4843194.1 DNA-binding protein H-NS [Roseateles oligotrophus]